MTTPPRAVPPAPSVPPVPSGPAMPPEAPTTAVTHAVGLDPQAGLGALSVWTERTAGAGEDADPLVLHHLPSRTGLVAVFDGAGGAGSGPSWTNGRGLSRSGAWTGSRVARLAVELWFRDCVEHHRPPEARVLEDRLREVLDAARPAVRSKVVGTMRRQLPTTMAAIRYRIGDTGVSVRTLWAGDSRAYVLTPSEGLQVLTRDHTDETDALAQLIQDPPMTNMVCADRPFRVESHAVPLNGPCVLLCATDGFFGYLWTPGDFESVLLESLQKSSDEADWAARLSRKVEQYTADDASLALVTIGFSDFRELCERFRDRYRRSRERYRGMPDFSDAQALRHWREQDWLRYRTEYERHMPEAGEVAE
ncbi:PP2C family protein-serine/threonine phosphatase [Kitasatospora cathayae]|uniref:Protein phosphatase 2C domain-containing protein n=1 Tax=Kitasatospora cathayae TaxID=3004092 RepID=A0ABY7Q9G4_9ACTN|nr:protein phosphatase 2C domain-containing protein [Kitasatospora sp. HUAS 3-15]WBP89273.1 protein phosphatase 2C domain-containing protein [Kitasatospora sp. HUAS 3-15]